jgi:hypothetical protein
MAAGGSDRQTHSLPARKELMNRRFNEEIGWKECPEIRSYSLQCDFFSEVQHTSIRSRT